MQAPIWSLYLGLSSLLLPLLALILYRRRRKIFRLLSNRLLGEEANGDEQPKSRWSPPLKRSTATSRYLACIEQQLLTTVDAAKRTHLLQTMESLNRWGFVRAGLLRSDLHGMDIYETKLLEFLEHGASSLMGISGMRGVGKTTLLKLMRTNTYGESNDYSFDYVLYVDAGDAGFTTAVLQDILARRIGLGSSWPRQTMSSDDLLSANVISSRLKDKRFLLLLDDLRGAIDLSAIGLPMPLGHRQVVIFATRDQAICVRMGCAAGNSIQMQRLGEDDAWNLFRYCVGDDKMISYDPQIKYIAKQIVAECRGFPSALCTVGRSMSTKRDFKEWMVAYDQIKRPLADKIQEMDDGDYPCLQFFEAEF